MLYYSMILSHLNYCNLAWASGNDHFISRLFILQKKAIRIICNAPYNAHSSPLFIQLNMLNVYDINTFNIASFMFMCSKGLLPPYILSKFSLNNSFHEYNTRSATNFHLPKIRTNVAKNSIYFKGPIVWNNIPTHLKNKPSSKSFKTQFKSHLLSLHDFD